MEYAMANARAMALFMVEDLSANTSTKMVEDLSINTSTKIVGTVVLMKKNILDMNDLKASLVDRVHELLGKRVYLQLISATRTDSANWEYGAKLGMPAYLEKWVPTPTPLIQRETKFTVTFEWDVETMGVPGAFIIRNYHHNEFYLKELTLEYVPGHGRVHFDCNSWVYPAHRYDYDRIFFSNKAYLPSQTPDPLRKYREQELVNLRGYGRKGELKKWDTVYDYAYYNDLGQPERGRDYARPVLGGSEQYPYPRRGKTGRKPNKKDPETESRLYALDMEIYVPRDERFSTVKFGDFVAYALKSFNQVVVGAAASLRDHRKEFESFQDIHDLYEGRISLPDNDTLKKIRNCFPSQIVKELLRNDGEKFLKFPMPAVIKENKSAWDTDEEFARETLAGPNPVIIKRLQAFPPTSGLDPQAYGDHTSTIKREDIENKLEGLTVGQALDGNKLFILDHHDALIPYLRRINTTSAKIYATRTLFFLQEDGTLKPLAIELSLPHPQGDKYGVISKVFTPAQRGINGSIWRLAKAYVAVNDSGVHQLISHWLNTHAVIEPFVIASHRQLSVVHPIHKLLHPHFRDTMNINAQARKNLINAGGVLELTVFPEKYALEMSSAIYRSWNFNDQALPVDLVKRGVAIRKSDNNSDDIELLIKDYPYAVDGLEIWSAIKTWVTEYCSFYYLSDEEVQDDEEIQSWWEEIRNEGHGDLKDKTWWIEMNTKENLIQACTIIIWIASAFHAAVNFGQYSYAGFLPNRPTVSRRFMPEQGTPEYAELTRDPDTVFLKTITSQFETLLGISLIEILSRHSAEELYLGQRETLEWTRDDGPLAAFERFRTKLVEIEKNVTARNSDGSLKNRNGAVKMPYTLLYPNTSDFTKEGGLTGKGIPNSVSI